MAKDDAERSRFARRQKGALDADAAEELFTKVDETGHPNEERAALERARRQGGAAAVDVDPLSGSDPSGSNIEKVITKTAVLFVLIFLVIVVLMQVSCGVIRRANTANLTESVTVRSVASALRGGVEWGNGFTQFPEDFSVQEADENTGRVEQDPVFRLRRLPLTRFSTHESIPLSITLAFIETIRVSCRNLSSLDSLSLVETQHLSLPLRSQRRSLLME